MQARLRVQGDLHGGRIDLGDAWRGRVAPALQTLGLDPRWKPGRWEVRCPWCGQRCAHVYDTTCPTLRCNRRNKCGGVSPVFDLLAERMGGADAVFAWFRDQGAGLPAPARPMPVQGGSDGGGGERPYPDRAELEAFVSSLGAIDDPTDPRSDSACRLLRLKGSDPACVAAHGIARMAPRPGAPMPACWPSAWLETHPIVVGAYDSRGRLRSVHARAVDPEAKPKTVWPRGCRASGLVFAWGPALDFLRSESWTAPEVRRVLVVEGLTDFVAATLWSLRTRDRTVVGGCAAHEECGCALPPVVLGVTSGSMSAVGGIRWPRGCRVSIGTDDDRAGDDYAARILAELPHHVRAERIRWKGARDA